VILMPAPISLPKGFAFAAMACGIKKSGAPDLAIIASENPASAVAAFTTNRVQAAPVLLSKAHLRQSRGRMRGILVNSGNANCCTGGAGIAAARKTAKALADELSCRKEEIFVCSTGVIGVPLPAERMLAAIPGLTLTLQTGPEAFAKFARGILTTDTRPKLASAEARLKGGTVRIAGCAKGAGMIAPQLHTRTATMLAFLLTDAALPPALLRRALAAAVEPSFNAITVDGDTSTNDTAVLFASGAAGARLVSARGAEFRRFVRALERVCLSLALQVVADGEGARHLIEIQVHGAKNDSAAVTIARTIAHSPLVKTALAGADPNWGRILAAAGRSGVPLDPGKTSITLAGIPVFRRGRPLEFDETAAHRQMGEHRYAIRVDLRSGKGRASIWTCDLSEGYVRINADYRT
jgi:glutamate N-acetyltransferase/amino-acid N-acetyltransferase